MTVQSEVRENLAEHRFELWIGDELAGKSVYQGEGRTLPFVHTEIDPRFEGQGLGSKLIRASLDAVRERGASVLPHCPFVLHFIEKHDEYLDLVPQERRTDFGLPGTARV
jgi:predicted GNAT family acetyltransferase